MKTLNILYLDIINTETPYEEYQEIFQILQKNIKNVEFYKVLTVRINCTVWETSQLKIYY